MESFNKLQEYLISPKRFIKGATPKLKNEAIKRLLKELYLKGPETVGIFRKSANAKHCRELKEKLETNCHDDSIGEYQIYVIASVLKECLRTLPDCLLTSGLYPQWIDVAKLIEPLHLQQEQLLGQQEQHNNINQTQSLDDSASSLHYGCYSSMERGNNSTTPNLRPIRRSPLTDNGRLLPNRAHSCSNMMPDFSINNNNNYIDKSNISYGDDDDVFLNSNDFIINSRVNSTSTTPPQRVAPRTSIAHHSMSRFALSERHSECIRLIRQLVATLTEPNVDLLRSVICVLWHISKNNDINKMSANNLGVCVGQSLLNDEHQTSRVRSRFFSSSNKSTGSIFTKRHRRAKSQSLLSSSSLSLSSSSSFYQLNGFNNRSNSNVANNNCYPNSKQESAKYVPMLVAFMIENASAIFGEDILSIYSTSDDIQKEDESISSSRASSSTSGLHSSSLTFSSEEESPHNTRSASLSPSNSSPSSVCSPSFVSSSTSPVQEESIQSHYGLKPSSSNVHPMLNRYSTYVNVLNRVPKIPVYFAASDYGGETIIYNPNPHLMVDAQFTWTIL